MRKLFLLLPLFLLACVVSSVQAIPTPSPESTIALPATPQAQISTETAESPCGVVIALKSLNLRVLPSEDSAADPQGLQRGDELTVVSKESGWWYVEVADGRRGYVKAEYVVECEK